MPVNSFLRTDFPESSRGHNRSSHQSANPQPSSDRRFADRGCLLGWGLGIDGLPDWSDSFVMPALRHHGRLSVLGAIVVLALHSWALPVDLVFTDIAGRSGIRFLHDN